jgi:hypothetical protein
MVALNQRDAQTKWGQLEVFMTQWRRIEALTAERGPIHLAGVTDRDDINPARLATNAPSASIRHFHLGESERANVLTAGKARRKTSRSGLPTILLVYGATQPCSYRGCAVLELAQLL